MAIERLSGGLSPADGSDPRTFPAIFNGAADEIDALDGRVTAVENGKAPLLAVENVQTVNYTLALDDTGRVVSVDSSSAVTVTVPLDSSVAFPVGTLINVYRAGSGAVEIEGASGVTVRNVGSISDQFGEVSLRKRDTNEWVLVGQVDEP